MSFEELESVKKMLNGLDNLIGKKINKIVLSEDKDYITFYTDDFIYEYEAYGECCSNSWIEDIESLIGQVVLKYEQKELSTVEDISGTLDIMSYVYTEKGMCKIDFRCDHNGYYGGYLELKKISKV